MKDVLSGDQLLTILEALSNPYRLRIVAILYREELYVSQLSRELGISRPLLYLHLQKLEEAQLIEGRLELSPNGKAMKYYKLNSFDITLNALLIAELTSSLNIKGNMK